MRRCASGCADVRACAHSDSKKHNNSGTYMWNCLHEALDTALSIRLNCLTEREIAWGRRLGGRGENPTKARSVGLTVCCGPGNDIGGRVRVGFQCTLRGAQESALFCLLCRGRASPGSLGRERRVPASQVEFESRSYSCRPAPGFGGGGRVLSTTLRMVRDDVSRGLSVSFYV